LKKFVVGVEFVVFFFDRFDAVENLEEGVVEAFSVSELVLV